MAEYSGCDRVLRKRKIHQLPYHKNATGTGKETKYYNAMKKYAYSRCVCCRRLNNEQLPVGIKFLRNKESKKEKFQRVSRDSEHVCPPFQWILLLYLAIKHSSRDYVTFYDVEKFVRHWFPYYRKKCFINNIFLTFTAYKHNCFTTPNSLEEKHCFRLWTVNKEFVSILEEETRFFVEQNKNEIKRAMEHPDQLPMLLEGYGVQSLGCDLSVYEI